MIQTSTSTKSETDVMSLMSCGMYLISVSDGIKDNGCIINSAIQITNEPVRIVFALGKRTYTHKLLRKTGQFNLCVLDKSVNPDLITRFGYASGREKSKFDGLEECTRSANGIYYLTNGSNAYMSFETVALADWDTHTLFTAKLTHAEILSSLPSLSYEVFQAGRRSFDT